MEDQPVDSEIQPRRRRRTFSANYKRRFLDEYDRCTKPGEKGALLRREGLYDSTIARWRKQMARKPKGARNAPRGRPQKTDEQRELEKLRAEVVQLKSSLEEAHHVIDVQKKRCDALESLRRNKTSAPSNSMPSSNSESE